MSVPQTKARPAFGQRRSRFGSCASGGSRWPTTASWNGDGSAGGATAATGSAGARSSSGVAGTTWTPDEPRWTTCVTGRRRTSRLGQSGWTTSSQASSEVNQRPERVSPGANLGNGIDSQAVPFPRVHKGGPSPRYAKTRSVPESERSYATMKSMPGGASMDDQVSPSKWRSTGCSSAWVAPPKATTSRALGAQSLARASPARACRHGRSRPTSAARRRGGRDGAPRPPRRACRRRSGGRRSSSARAPRA